MKSASLQYANALADIALAQGAAEPVVKQLRDISETYTNSAELRNFLASPAVTRAEKHGVIEKIAARLGATRIVRNFLLVVADHQRTQMLPEIVAAFEGVIRAREGKTEAEVFSAVELTDAQKKDLAQTLEKKTGKKVDTKFSLDPALLGGVVVRIGDTIYDGSVRNRLNELRSKLATA